MRQYFSFITAVIVLTSCMSNDATICQTEWYKQFDNKALTAKEKDYVKKLETRGYFKVNIQPPTIGVDMNGTSIYSIEISSKIKHTNENVDSIKNINFEIAKELYNDIIEDSILFDIGKIGVTIIVENSFIKGSSEEFYDSYYKKQLEKELKFKVNKKNDGSFVRVF